MNQPVTRTWVPVDELRKNSASPARSDIDNTLWLRTNEANLVNNIISGTSPSKAPFTTSLANQSNALRANLVNKHGENYLNGIRDVTNDASYFTRLLEAWLKDEPYAIMALEKYFDSEWQIMKDSNTWVSISYIGWTPQWERSFIMVGVGQTNAEWMKYYQLMNQLHSELGLVNNDPELMRLRHELGHDVHGRYLLNLDAEQIKDLENGYARFQWTFSDLASASFYTNRWRKEQLSEDFAEMISLYMRNPESFERFATEFIRVTVQQGTSIEERVFIEKFFMHVRNAYMRYIA